MTNQIIKTNSSVPGFVQEKLATLEGALQYAKVLCDSKILPAHFYEKIKGADGKMYPDYSKPKPETVVVVLQYGQEIGMSHMQAIQQLVPVNNIVTIKGDGAKALIMGSGKVETWKEEEIWAGDDFVGVKITSKRRDTGEELSRTFTVLDAKKAGLWISEDTVQKYPQMKYSTWYKYPKRMIRYRALGFISRDLYSDVLQGVYIEEEAIDIDIDNTKIETTTGMTVSVEPKTAKIENSVMDKPIVVKPSESVKIQKSISIEEAEVVEDTEEEQGISQQSNTDELPFETANADKAANDYEFMTYEDIIAKINTEKESILQWLNEKVVAELGETLDSLYEASGKTRGVRQIKNLIKTIKNNMPIKSWANTELDLPLSDNEDKGFAAEELVSVKLKMLLETPTPRDFDCVFDILNELNKIGIKSKQIKDYVDKECDFASNSDDYLSNAVFSDVVRMINYVNLKA